MTCAVSWCRHPARTQHENWLMCGRHAGLMIAKEAGDFTLPMFGASSREKERWLYRYERLLAGFAEGDTV